MSQEKLLASLCSASDLPPPLYDLEVTGGDKVTVCCIVGRSEVSTLSVPFFAMSCVPGLQSRMLLQCFLIG